MGLLEDLKVEALIAGQYSTQRFDSYLRPIPMPPGRLIPLYTGKAFDERDKTAAYKCMRYQTLVNWQIPHLNAAIKRLQIQQA
jgi:hypothetical protein